MDDLQLVTYCGLYCGLCGERARIPGRARALREVMIKEGYEFWGGELPRFGDFWGFLTDLCDPDHACPGCRQGGGPPFCAIRKCARERSVDVCPFCDEYPCERLLAIAKGYPTLLADGQRLREIGLGRWIEEQGERAGTGFAYVDIRCYPYSVPEE
jgi:Protein of unknown function (DUF3795)